MTSDKFIKFSQIVYNADKNCMFSRVGRKGLAMQLATECNLWFPNVQTYVEEMHGLNFHLAEDKQTFIDFAEVGL